MSRFVLTVPGTFAYPLEAQARTRLLAALQGVDPEQVGTVPEDLELLSVDPGASTFVLRLEIEAEDRNRAKEKARAVARGALDAAGYREADSPTGTPAVTAIDIG
jgi:hypothetical protein